MRQAILVLLLSGLLGSCTLNSQKAQSGSERSFSKIKLVEGTRDETVLNDSGKKWNMRMTVPTKVIPTAKNNLIIALHWAGGYGTYKEFHDCLVVPSLQNLNAIIVSPEGERQLWSTANNEEKILFLIAKAEKYWDIDPDKIAVVGYSNGGNGCWYFAENHSDLLSAAIPIASAYPVKKKIEVPLYVIHGAKDELFEVKKTEQWVANTVNAGSNVTLVVNSELSHFQGCAYVDELKKAGIWLKQIWKEK
jgi:predicted peptidase